MNKDEMIEEMAKITNYTAFDFTQGAIESATIYTAMAEALYNAGYRKVTEDEIVESMKTYERARQETAREILELIVDESGVNLLGAYYKLPFHTYNKIKREYGIELED